MKNLLFRLIILFLIYPAAHAQEEYLTALTNLRQAEKSPERVPYPITLFLQHARSNSLQLQMMLLEECKLHYRNRVKFPSQDPVLSFVPVYDISSQAIGVRASLEGFLSFSGTRAEINMKSSVTPQSHTLTFSILQPLVQNAFGITDRLIKKRIGTETEIARLQIAESIEDYLAVLIKLYYTWYITSENLRTARDSYLRSQEINRNVREKFRLKIADIRDVNQMRIQVIQKEETVLTLSNTHVGLVREIFEITGSALDFFCAEKKTCPQLLQPMLPEGAFSEIFPETKDQVKEIIRSTRAYKIISLSAQNAADAEKESRLARLPSCNLLVDYSLSTGETKNSADNLSLAAGLSLSSPLPGIKNKAVHKTAVLERTGAHIAVTNTEINLWKTIADLRDAITFRTRLLQGMQEKIDLGREVTAQEQKLYEQGSVSLSDLITQINNLDRYRYEYISAVVALRLLHVQWLKLGDRLLIPHDVSE